MEIGIGAQVIGRDGPLGHVHRLVVDLEGGHVDDVVVRHHRLLGDERVVSIELVTAVQDGVVQVDLDEKGFHALPQFSDGRRYAADPNYEGPPGFDTTEDELDRVVAGGGQVAFAAKPFGFPGGEQLTPDDFEHPVIREGMPVLDVNGEKVGELARLVVETETGLPVQVTVREGVVLHHEVNLPRSWVQGFDEAGVLLNVAKESVESLAPAAPPTEPNRQPHQA
jgi:uncharacterized protein YrrD